MNRTKDRRTRRLLSPEMRSAFALAAVLLRLRQRTSMAGTFERWGNRWLKFGSPAGWFAYFLRTESGQLLLLQGVKQLAAAVDSLPDHEWQHNDLGALFTEVVSLCWKQRQKDVEADADLRTAFLHILAVLCARQIPEALHLRSKVSGILSGS